MPENVRIRLKWQKRVIAISTTWQEERLPIEAQCLDNFAVHLTVETSKSRSLAKWTLTHILSGEVILRCRKKADARKIADYLAYRCSKAFDQRAAEDIRPMLSERVYEWLRECCHDKCWLPPP